MFETLPSRVLLSTNTPLLADFDHSGQVDSADFTILSQHFGEHANASSGDANGDGVVNALDFNALATEYGSNVHGSLLFSDEFIGKKLSGLWTTSQYWWPDDHTVYGGDELEGYDSSALKVKDGLLQITARKQTKYGEPYVSGLIQTGGKQDHPSSPKFSFKYGYMEVRAKLPTGKGLWPAIWMMPASHDDANGEIDVMENLGGDPSTVYLTTHRHGKQQGHQLTEKSLSKGFHTFAVDWQPDHITWYVDGKAEASATDPSLICNEAMYPILNVAVGGNWPGNPNKHTKFPATMEVDYVRVYQ